MVTAVLTGLAVQAALVVAGFDTDFDWRTLPIAFGNAALYSFAMWGGAVLTFRWTVARWPLRSAGDVARHVGAQVATSLVTFAVGSALVRLVMHEVYPPGVFVVIAAIAALATAMLATLLYGVLAAQRLRAIEAAAVAAELRALRAQINPHFLFNALNTIAALVRLRPADAERVTEDLADLFRYSLAASERPTVTLAEEVGSARLYLAIERARYGDALTVEVDVPDSLGRLPVPSLVLQPLVENAVKHGVRHGDGRGTVRVSAHEEGGRLVLRVEDSGPGFGTDRIDEVLGRGTGLTNVAGRLRASGATLTLDAQAPGGAVVVHLPRHP